jgi:NAD(P)-dependent dehydrogenase (short-subunit alcohol dehydrogenase family)
MEFPRGARFTPPKRPAITAPPEQIEAEFFAKGRPSSLLQRMSEPDEIANLVAYVASPLSSATNGAALRVDGGVTPTIG